MGWSSGSEMLERIIIEMNGKIGYDSRKFVYNVLIDEFENADCDTIQECLGNDEAFDEVYYSIYPKDGEDD